MKRTKYTLEHTSTNGMNPDAERAGTLSISVRISSD